MIFLHGWPQIGLIWRAQVEAFAAEGWRCLAPDMRGYGGSSAPSTPSAYTVEEIVTDMLELHDHLGAKPAVWVGHDWGCPIAAELTVLHPERSRALALISVPYLPGGFALPILLPLIDRSLYPVEEFPNGQWDYFRYYQTHFELTVSDLDADVKASLASIFRSGNPALIGNVAPSASLAKNGGRFGAAHRASATAPDPALWPEADFVALYNAFREGGFRPANSWYLNDEANIAYALTAHDGGRIRQPVLFINGNWDLICDVTRSVLGDPMRRACEDLTLVDLQGGHWLPLERKSEVVVAIRNWLGQIGIRA